MFCSSFLIWSPSPASSEASAAPSQDWGVFFDTIGPIKVNISEPGVAVKLEIPREFIGSRQENDTSFVKSDISDDYYYYEVTDQELHYPYDPNSPYTIEIWHPPRYLQPTSNSCFREWVNYTVPRYVLFEELDAPDLAGIYNITVFIAPNMLNDETPNYPSDPNIILKVPVSMREEPGWIEGFIEDDLANEHIKAKGVVYAVHEFGEVARAYVNSSTGFFNLTGLYEGEYNLTASAGYYPSTGFAYSPTSYITTVHVNRGSRTWIGNFTLNRGCTITGTITYIDKFGTPTPPLDTPYLNALNFQELNYTVEAYDEDERIVASQTYTSKNQPNENFRLIIRNGTKYTGYSGLGTEYSGFGPGAYILKVWVFGFIQPDEVTVTIGGYGEGCSVDQPIYLPYGGIVSGKIILKNGATGAYETPREGEFSALNTLSGNRFGGHIIAELFDEHGVLKGLTLINGTYANGTTRYADEFSLRFWILGFSELHNNSYSGAWRVGSYPGPSPWDYGLETGDYYLRVTMRGYIQEEEPLITLSDQGNSTVTVFMERGGAFQVTVYSYGPKPGTRQIQALIAWRFLDLCPPPYLRVYFYTEYGAEIGYVEKPLRLGIPGVTNVSAYFNFTGHNWPLHKIIFYGYQPTAVDEGTYRIKAYTYGYVQTYDITVYVPMSMTVAVAFPLIIGCGIHGGVPLMADDIFTTLPHNATIRVQALRGVKQGVEIVHASTGASQFTFQFYGFYGRGHFFYVDPEGVLWKDYGLDTGTYTVFIPEFPDRSTDFFADERHFHQEATIQVELTDLAMEVGAYFRIHRMIKIYGTVTAFDEVRFITRLLSWVSVSSPEKTAYSIDGYYALHIPRDTSYDITYAIPGYLEHDVTLSTNNQVEYSTLLEKSGAVFGATELPEFSLTSAIFLISLIGTLIIIRKRNIHRETIS